jgi:hypothetical protein
MTSTSEIQWVVLFLVPYELTKKYIPLCENICYSIDFQSQRSNF